jgi:hypothetical protein
MTAAMLSMQPSLAKDLLIASEWLVPLFSSGYAEKSNYTKT